MTKWNIRRQNHCVYKHDQVITQLALGNCFQVVVYPDGSDYLSNLYLKKMKVFIYFYFFKNKHTKIFIIFFLKSGYYIPESRLKITLKKIWIISNQIEDLKHLKTKFS